MKKRVLSMILVSVLVFTLTGCTKTTTETVTDANGNTTTTTTVEENGQATTTVETTEAEEEKVEAAAEDVAEDVIEENDYIIATLTIENTTGVDIVELYFSASDSDEWGNDICEGDLLDDGASFVFENAFTYSADALLWDIKAVDGNGDSVEFNGCDMSYAADCENIHITLAVDDDEDSETGFCAYIE